MLNIQKILISGPKENINDQPPVKLSQLLMMVSQQWTL